MPFCLPGGKASFKEYVIFTTTIPIPNQDEPEKTEMKGTTLKEDLHDVIRDRAAIHDIVRSTNHVTHHVTNHVTNHDTNQYNIRIRQLLEACKEEKNREELQNVVGLKNRGYFSREFLKPAVESGLIALTIPDAPKSSKQKYLITELGRTFLQKMKSTIQDTTQD